MVMLAKGNRSQQVTDACHKHGSWKIEVENFPAFILVDDKGNDFFQQIHNRCATCVK